MVCINKNQNSTQSAIKSKMMIGPLNDEQLEVVFMRSQERKRTSVLGKTKKLGIVG
jgi:hypothetical protein